MPDPFVLVQGAQGSSREAPTMYTSLFLSLRSIPEQEPGQPTLLSQPSQKCHIQSVLRANEPEAQRNTRIWRRGAREKEETEHPQSIYKVLSRPSKARLGMLPGECGQLTPAVPSSEGKSLAGIPTPQGAKTEPLVLPNASQGGVGHTEGFTMCQFLGLHMVPLLGVS